MMQDVALNAQTYEEAVEIFKTLKVNAPGFVIVSNPDINSSVEHGIGTVIARSRDGLDY